LASKVERPSPSKRKRPKEAGPAARGLRLLARRDHTRRELAAKLSPHVEDATELEALLDHFAARGWLSESRVVEQVLHTKRERFGPARIRQALLQRGVPESLIAPALQSVRTSELEAARAVWARKFRVKASTPAERGRQVRFLQSRGFSLGIALRVVGGRSRSEEDGA
jgi:regulatory protein